MSRHRVAGWPSGTGVLARFPLPFPSCSLFLQTSRHTAIRCMALQTPHRQERPQQLHPRHHHPQDHQPLLQPWATFASTTPTLDRPTKHSMSSSSTTWRARPCPWMSKCAISGLHKDSSTLLGRTAGFLCVRALCKALLFREDRASWMSTHRLDVCGMWLTDRIFSPTTPCENVHSQKNRLVFYEAEPGYWLLLVWAIDLISFNLGFSNEMPMTRGHLTRVSASPMDN